MRILLLYCVLFCLSSCSPLRSSPQEAKVQLELTLHELKTNLDDQRHDLNCCQTELQILNGRIKYYEHELSTLKQQELEKHQVKIDQLIQQLQALDKKIAGFESLQTGGLQDIRQLSTHANETSAALLQFKDRLLEIEQDLQTHNRRFEEVAKLRAHFEGPAKQLHNPSEKIYKVRTGDSLEKIARSHKTTIERIKKANDLNQDLIIVGQELRIPE